MQAMKIAQIFAYAVLGCVLLTVSFALGWTACLKFTPEYAQVAQAPETPMMTTPDGFKIPITPGMTFSKADKDTSSSTTKNPTWLGNSRDKVEEIKWDGAQIGITSDAQGNTQLNAETAALMDKWKSTAKIVPVILVIAGIVLIVGGGVIWLKFAQMQTGLICMAAGLGLILLAIMAESAAWIVGGVVAVAAVIGAWWFYRTYIAKNTSIALAYIAPVIESLEKVTFAADTEFMDHRWTPTEVDKVKKDTTLASYIKEQISQKVPASDSQAVKSAVGEAKANPLG